jgi:hypothetical protein
MRTRRSVFALLATLCAAGPAGAIDQAYVSVDGRNACDKRQQHDPEMHVQFHAMPPCVGHPFATGLACGSAFQMR